MKYLQQQNKGTLSFPHSIDQTKEGLLKVIYNEKEPISVGDQFLLTATSKDLVTVHEVRNVRPAKGEWGDIKAIYCEILYI